MQQSLPRIPFRVGVFGENAVQCIGGTAVQCEEYATSPLLGGTPDGGNGSAKGWRIMLMHT